jgi:MFS family permease
VVLHAPDNIWLIGVMLLVLGTLFGLGYPAFSVYPMGITTKEVYPLAFSVVNTAASLGAAVFPLAAGFILDRSGWETVFYFLALSSLACLALLATVDEPVPD